MTLRACLREEGDMLYRILVVCALILLVLPAAGCAKLITTPDVRITWTPSGDTEGNEFPAEATVTQWVQYGLEGSGVWTTIPEAESVPYEGMGVTHEAFWTVPDGNDYVFRIAVHVLYEGVEFVRYCETDAVQYFGIGDFDCDVDADQ